MTVRKSSGRSAREHSTTAYGGVIRMRENRSTWRPSRPSVGENRESEFDARVPPADARLVLTMTCGTRPFSLVACRMSPQRAPAPAVTVPRASSTVTCAMCSSETTRVSLSDCVSNAWPPLRKVTGVAPARASSSRSCASSRGSTTVVRTFAPP